MTNKTIELWLWRHPKAKQSEGRCIGRTDLDVDARRVRRLARRIRRQALRHGLPQIVITSPLQRCQAVGRYLRRLGWVHHIDAALVEMDFGLWDGLPWDAISRNEIDTWCANFLSYHPGGGESLDNMFNRVAAWRIPETARIIVGHGGWMLVRQWLGSGRSRPIRADDWPSAPGYGTCWRVVEAVSSSHT